MENQKPEPRFPLVQAVAALTAVCAACAAVGLWWVSMHGYGGAEGSRGFVALGVGVAWASSIAAVLPVAWLGPRGVMPTAVAYFTGAAFRFLVCLGFCGWFWAEMPAAAGWAIAGVMGAYLPTLFVEAAIVGRYLWKKDSLAGAGVQSNQDAFAAGVRAC